ncbi:tyrosine-type recombinase/integrase [Halorubrum saccharovorum]|uniref:tyrosine-type recombinase/integrase n=1 Tax=Halorubrum saccharovorum TaxID=2248 RepID=UPI0009B5D3D4|nr:site-specific integrase [Halorubrum saccharovorum]
MSLDYCKHAKDVEKVIDKVHSRKTDSTANRYAGNIRVFAKWCDTDDAPINNPFAATVVDIEDFLSHLADDLDYAYKTVNVYISALAVFYDEAEKLADGGRGIPDPRRESNSDPLNWENPASKATIPDMENDGTKRAKSLEGKDYEDKLTTDEVEKLVKNATSPVTRNAAIIEVMYHGMLRRKEAAYLKVSDINRDDRIITIRSEVAKNGNKRRVPYTRDLDNYLRPWLEVDRDAYALAPDSEYLFLSNEREHLSPFHIGRIIHNAAESANLQEVLFTNAVEQEIHRVTGHSLRRSGATRRWEAGTDIYTLKQWLGHSSVDTTKGYINADSDELIDKNRKNW